MSRDPNLNMLMTWWANNNDTTGVIRSSTQDLLRPILSLSVLLVVIGIISNIALIVLVVKRRLYKHSVFQLVANLAVVEVVRCLLVLPLMLVSIFIRGWRLGSFMCFVFPVLLPCTIHVSVFGILAAFVFRYLKVVHNTKCPIPAWTCIVTSWLLSVAIQTPHAAFKRYIQLTPLLGSTYDGVGICVLRPGAEDRNKEYVLSVFLIFFVGIFLAVLVLALLIHLRIRKREREFNPQSASILMEMNIRVSERDNEEEDNLKYSDSAMLDYEDINRSNLKNDETRDENLTNSPLKDFTLISKKPKLKEDKRMQKFLVVMAFLFAILWLPFYILYILEAFCGQGEQKNDLLYLLLLLTAHLSSWTLPVTFSFWQMDKPMRTRIRASLFERHAKKSKSTV